MGQSRIPSQLKTLLDADDRAVSSSSGASYRESNFRPAWEPLFLRRWLLLTLAVFFASLSVTIYLIWRFGEKGGGYTILSSNHYYWTYGPTAVLVIVVAAWRQVDFACKVLMPWSVLNRGSHPASSSVLLDYISSFQVISFFNALRAHHYTIVFTIAGFTTLKLVTLASTGLFVLELSPTPMQSMAATRITKIAAPVLNLSAILELFEPSIVYTAFAVSQKGLPYVEGTSTASVYESFALSSPQSIENASMNADVQAFVPAFKCFSQPVSIQISADDSADPFPQGFIQLLNSNCSLQINGTGTPISLLNPSRLLCPSRQLMPLYQRFLCDSDPASDQNYWELLTLADVRYNQTLTNSTEAMANPNNINATSSSTTLQTVVGVGCQVDYSISTVRLFYNITGADGSQPTNIELLSSAPATSLTGFSMEELGKIVESSLSAASTMFGDSLSNERAEEYPNVLFKMMAGSVDGTYESLLDATTLAHAAESTLNQIALQIAYRHILQADNTPISVQVQYGEFKLQVGILSMIIMLSGCAIMVLMAILVGVFRPRANSFAHANAPSSAMILAARSQDFNHVLEVASKGDEPHFRATLEIYKYSMHTPSEATGGMHIQIDVSAATEQNATGAVVQSRDELLLTEPKWFIPLTIRRPVLALTFLLPLIAITLLEILQHLSDRIEGITAVPGQRTSITVIYTRFLPALFMLLVTTMVNALDFNVCMLTPFHNLSRGAATADRTLVDSLIGKPFPVTIWTVVKHRHWGALCSLTATLIAATLTIIVSGLFTVQQFNTDHTTSLAALDKLDVQWPNSVINDNSAAIVTSLTESLGLDYPPFTYAEVAFPTLKIWNQSTKPSLGLQNKLNTQLDALRASLDCNSITSAGAYLNVSSIYNPRTLSARSTVSLRSDLPLKCQFGGQYGNESFLEFTYSLPMDGNASYVGKLLDLHVGPWTDLASEATDELATTIQKDNPLGCPSLAFVYGHADANQASNNAFTALICQQRIQTLNSNVTFNYPAFTIDHLTPPEINEASAVSLHPQNQTETALQFRIQQHFDNTFSPFNQSTQAYQVAGIAQPLDNFFQGVLFGREPIAHQHLGNPADGKIVFDAIQGLYRRYMAQAISSNMRVNLSTISTTSSVQEPSNLTPATLIGANQSNRLFQNSTSKLILQCLLGVIFILCVLSCYLTRLHSVVKHNPCCIAGMASLFAGSEMCDPTRDVHQDLMVPVAEWMGEQELCETWKGALFQLGRWGDRYGVEVVRYKQVPNSGP